MTNKGELRWRVLDGAMTAPMLMDFMASLIRGVSSKMFLIFDSLRVHRARFAQDWLAGRRLQIEVSYLPADSPELNPDESLNGP